MRSILDYLARRTRDGPPLSVPSQPLHGSSPRLRRAPSLVFAAFPPPDGTEPAGRSSPSLQGQEDELTLRSNVEELSAPLNKGRLK